MANTTTNLKPKGLKRKGTDSNKKFSKKLKKNATVNVHKSDQTPKKADLPAVIPEKMSLAEAGDKYTVLKDEKLKEKFMKVPLNNNQKGRIRQLLRDNLKDTSNTLLPDVINHKIQNILQKSNDLSDSQLRQVRVLYNMLQTQILGCDTKKVVASKDELAPDTEESIESAAVVQEKKGKRPKKDKGPKRYVVFIGNLPLTINKTKILEHFWHISEDIQDVRIPKRTEDSKSCIAYLELKNETAFELALSKNHSMLDNKRINVLYSTQKITKVTQSDAKGKSAKLAALQKSGKLIGSNSANKKRSFRRKKQKEALAKEQASEQQL